MPFLEIQNGKHIRLGGRPSIAVYNDRLELPEDFEATVSHEASFSVTGHWVKAPRSPQKGRTTWVMGDSWASGDNTEIFLNETGTDYDEELTGEVYESHIFNQANMDKSPRKGKRKQMKVTVSMTASTESLH